MDLLLIDQIISQQCIEKLYVSAFQMHRSFPSEEVFVEMLTPSFLASTTTMMTTAAATMTTQMMKAAATVTTQMTTATPDDYWWPSIDQVVNGTLHGTLFYGMDRGAVLRIIFALLALLALTTMIAIYIGIKLYRYNKYCIRDHVV
jgi:hypothetical protein